MMKVLFIGSMTLGSALYSRCLRDIQSMSLAAQRQRYPITFIVSDTPAGQLAAKLLGACALKFSEYSSELAIPQASTVLVYEEDEEADSHYEETVFELQNEEAEVIIRKMPSPGSINPTTVEPPDDPYAEFRKAFTLIDKRIHPLPTRGPQVWRVVEIRPNGGRPWFDTGGLNNENWNG
jgi:hypothetical protein